MLRVCVVALFLAVASGLAHAQTPGVLHVSVTLQDSDARPLPVPRHALLISDNPPTASPRRVITGPDGSVDVRLPRGNYTVESDRPVALGGRAYQWTQVVDIAAGQTVSLALTADNADVDTSNISATAAGDTDPKLLAMRWKDSLVAVWTPTARATGFLATDTGLIITNQRSVGTATSVEIQLSSTSKVAGRVVATDQEHDVAVVIANPRALGSVRPLDPGCDAGSAVPLAEGTDIVALTLPTGSPVAVIPGSLSRVEPRTIVTDLILDDGGAGGPAFGVDGRFVGLTSVIQNDDQRTGGHVSLSSAEATCRLLARVDATRPRPTVPNVTALPLEPARPFPVAALENAVKTRGGSLRAYTMSSSDFDVAFMTPVQLYAQQKQDERVGDRSSGSLSPPKQLVEPLSDFANWSAYVAARPPVLLIRATPRLVEGFWTTVARGAAMTQGVNLPPMRHVKAGFARMTVKCGVSEVIPIHPLVIEQRVSDTDTVDEGLYVFAPDALGPHCGTVSIELFSQKEPTKGDSRVIAPATVEQLWRDFEPYRSQP